MLLALRYHYKLISDKRNKTYKKGKLDLLANCNCKLDLMPHLIGTLWLIDFKIFRRNTRNTRIQGIMTSNVRFKRCKKCVMKIDSGRGAMHYNGSSVVDYIMVSKSLKFSIDRFKVLYVTDISDHRPLTCHLKTHQDLKQIQPNVRLCLPSTYGIPWAHRINLLPQQINRRTGSHNMGEFQSFKSLLRKDH